VKNHTLTTADELERKEYRTRFGSSKGISPPWQLFEKVRGGNEGKIPSNKARIAGEAATIAPLRKKWGRGKVRTGEKGSYGRHVAETQPGLAWAEQQSPKVNLTFRG